jgi:intraflagellar transport protein 88
MYKMALDILPATSKEMRFKITKNIGHAYVKMGEFQNAISSY